MSFAFPYYTKLLRMQNALREAYARDQDLETDFAFIMRYSEALLFQQAMKMDHENRMRTIREARMTLREWPGGEDLPPISDNVVDIPPPPGQPPAHGLWSRIFGIQVVIVPDDERRI